MHNLSNDTFLVKEIINEEEGKVIEKVFITEQLGSIDNISVERQNQEETLFIINEFLARCILINNYKPSSKYDESICLSDTGKKLLDRLQIKFNLEENSLTEAKIALMLASEENINFELTDFDNIIKTMDKEIIGRKLLFPYLYGTELYNKFHLLFSNRSTTNDYEIILEEDETVNMLQVTPIGVFQIKDVIIGPFGVLKSKEIRLMPLNYSSKYPLWHCSDISCYKLHNAVLSTSENIIQDLYREARIISKITVKYKKFRNNIIQINPYDYNKIDELVFLIGTFPEEELRLLLANLIDNFKEVRQFFPNDGEFKGLWHGKGEQITNSLEHNQCIQLILLYKNEMILKSLEELIFKNVIHIPETEIRKGKVMLRRRGIFNTNTQCSKYGFRTVININKETNTALIRLKNLINELYSNTTEKKRLEWKLRNFEGSTFNEKLGRYILTENPREIITNLIFDNQLNVNATLEYLNYSEFDNLLDPSKEDYYVNMILWKLGFEITVFPTYQSVFWKRNDQFLKVIKNNQVFHEEGRELIRSSGVNFFVSLEEILDQGLSFISWVLLSDHYFSTNFTFTIEDARAFTSKMINDYNYKINDTEYLRFDGEGKNTLYPLIKGFAVIAEICQNYLDSKEKYNRIESEYPSYYNKTDIYDFPFKHKALLLDLERADVNRILKLLNNIAHTLESKNISNVRNRIKHNRPIHEFPTISELDDICLAINEVVQKMELEGVLPTTYINSGTENDEFGRGFVKYKNYKGSSIYLSNSSQFIRSGMPLYKKIQLILPSVHINNSIDKIRFNYLEKTRYSTYWYDYPKRNNDSVESNN